MGPQRLFAIPVGLSEAITPAPRYPYPPVSMDLPNNNDASSSYPPPSSLSSDDQEWEFISSPSSSPQQTSTAILEASRSITSQPIMPGWKDDYLAALLEAERSNPVSFDLVEACKLNSAKSIQPSLSSPLANTTAFLILSKQAHTSTTA